MTRIFPLVALLLLGGCYAYSHVPGPAPVGTDVEIELTDAGAADLARLIGPNVVSLRGRILQNGADTITVAVESVLKRSGADEFWTKETLGVARSNIASVTTRRFSAGRSTLLGLTAVAGAFIMKAAIEAAVDGGTDKPRPPGQ